MIAPDPSAKSALPARPVQQHYVSPVYQAVTPEHPPDESSNHLYFVFVLLYLIFYSGPFKMRTREEISEYMMKHHGRFIDARMISRYVDDLNKAGFHIIKVEKGNGDPRTRYYCDLSFSPCSTAIASLLIEMAGFLSREASDMLIRETMHLAPDELEKKMRKASIFSNLAKTNNQQVGNSMYIINEAIVHNRKVEFHCFEPYYDGTHLSRHENERCVAEPIAFVANSGNLYLWCIREVKGERKRIHLRMDYIEDVQLLAEPVSNQCIECRKIASEQFLGMFKMYDGIREQVTLEFPNYCLRSVYDKFGHDIHPRLISGEGHNAIEQVTVNVAVSRYFFSWVGESMGEMKIVAPETVREKFYEFVEEYAGKNGKKKQPAAATTDCGTTGEPNQK